MPKGKTPEVYPKEKDLKIEQSKIGAAVSEKSFFATSESIGAYWNGVESGRKRHARLKGTGAAQTSKAPTRIVVVNPIRSAL